MIVCDIALIYVVVLPALKLVSIPPLLVFRPFYAYLSLQLHEKHVKVSWDKPLSIRGYIERLWGLEWKVTI